MSFSFKLLVDIDARRFVWSLARWRFQVRAV
jgi:hypothetical protein